MVVKDVTTVEEAVAALQEIVAMQVEEGYFSDSYRPNCIANPRLKNVTLFLNQLWSIPSS